MQFYRIPIIKELFKSVILMEGRHVLGGGGGWVVSSKNVKVGVE